MATEQLAEAVFGGHQGIRELVGIADSEQRVARPASHRAPSEGERVHIHHAPQVWDRAEEVASHRPRLSHQKVAIWLGRVPRGERLSHGQTLRLMRDECECCADKPSLALGSPIGETCRSDQGCADAVPVAELHTADRHVVRGHGEGRILGQRRFEEPLRAARIVLRYETQPLRVKAVRHERGCCDVGNPKRGCAQVECPGQLTRRAVNEGEGLRALHRVRAAQRAPHEIDASRLEPERPVRRAIEGAFQQLRGPRLPRGPRNRHTGVAEGSELTDHLVQPRRAHDLQSRQAREVRGQKASEPGSHLSAVSACAVLNGAHRQHGRRVVAATRHRGEGARDGYRAGKQCHRDRDGTPSLARSDILHGVPCWRGCGDWFLDCGGNERLGSYADRFHADVRFG